MPYMVEVGCQLFHRENGEGPLGWYLSFTDVPQIFTDVPQIFPIKYTPPFCLFCKDTGVLFCRDTCKGGG